MINSIDRVFLKDAPQRTVQCPRRIKIMAKRLLDHHALPTALRRINAAPTLALGHQVSSVNLSDDWFIKIRRHRKVEEDISPCARLGIKRMNGADNGWPRFRGSRIASDVVNPIRQRSPRRFFKLASQRLACVTCKILAELFVGLGAPADAKHLRARVNGTTPVHFIERGNQLSVRQIS